MHDVKFVAVNFVFFFVCLMISSLISYVKDSTAYVRRIWFS